jgi:hypothetical protein
MKTAIPIFQLQIVLKNSKPKIWRRIQVQSDVLLSDFHKMLQTTLGWTNSHLHQFIKDRKFYTLRLADDDMWDELDNTDYTGMRIRDLLQKEKEKIVYEYDFGDGWEHDIILEKVLPNIETLEIPICTGGKMNCPPEDCGGIWGYFGLMEIIKQRQHPEYDSYIEWLGGEFDPVQFDTSTVNQLLAGPDFGCIEIYD